MRYATLTEALDEALAAASESMQARFVFHDLNAYLVSSAPPRSEHWRVYPGGRTEKRTARPGRLWVDGVR